MTFRQALLSTQGLPPLLLFVNSPALGLYVALILLAFAPLSIAVDGATVFGAIRRALAVGRPAVGQLLLLSLALAFTLLPVFLVAGVPEILDAGRLGTAGRVISLILWNLAGALTMIAVQVAYIALYRQRTASAVGHAAAGD